MINQIEGGLAMLRSYWWVPGLIAMLPGIYYYILGWIRWGPLWILDVSTKDDP
jgi:hypothetical protein